MIEGIDVADYQSPSEWRGIPNLRFIFIKATEGTAPQVRFGAHLTAAHALGIPIIGAYHFGRDDVDVASQVHAFLAVAGNQDAYALDTEGAHYFTSVHGRAFIAGMHAAGKKIGLYASEYGYPEWGQDWNWIANYSQEPRHHYDIWQYGPAAKNVDGDRYRGTIDELRVRLGITAVETEMKYRIIRPAVGTVEVVIDGASIVTPDGRSYAAPKGSIRDTVAVVELLKPLDASPGDRKTAYLVGKLSTETSNSEVALLLAYAGKFTPTPVAVSGFTQADLDAALKADRGKARIVYS